ncbi:hypothetical protein MK280_07090, partial [Myxococcota bacterium]|nr:hypothetical protein [Myxococcota bacterium]
GVVRLDRPRTPDVDEEPTASVLEEIANDDLFEEERITAFLREDPRSTGSVLGSSPLLRDRHQDPPGRGVLQAREVERLGLIGGSRLLL